MNDEPTRLPEGFAPSAPPTGIYEHRCEHDGCTAWAGWGFSRRKDEQARWFCSEHRGYGERYL